MYGAHVTYGGQSAQYTMQCIAEALSEIAADLTDLCKNVWHWL